MMKHNVIVELSRCKGVSLLFLLLLFTLLAPAQTTQVGYAKTKGRMDSKGNLIPGTRIGGVSIQLVGGHSTVADANGNFTLTAPDKKFYLSDVQKQGYVLTDPDILKKQYVCSANPLVISMETKEKLADDQLAAERKLRRQLQKQLQQKEEEIDALKEENKITEEEYRQALQQLYAYQESNEKLVSDMAKRYAELDYDLLDEFYRQVSFCIENGDLVKADSLLRSRGNVSQQIEEARKKAQALNEEREQLRQAEAVLASDIEELGRRCYSYYEKFASQFENDSAAYYLELRANLDTMNVGWLKDAGAFISEYLADDQKALSYYQHALRQALAQHGENHPEVAKCYSGIGALYVEMGQYDQSMEYYQKALDMMKSIYGENHPDVAVIYNGLGVSYASKNEFDQALEYLHKALTIAESVYGEAHHVVAGCNFSLGALYGNKGDLAQALTHFSKALEIRKSIYGENHPDVAVSYHNLGLLYSLLGDYTKALEYAQKGLDIQKTFYAEKHPLVAVSYSTLGSIYDGIGEYDLSFEFRRNALAILKLFYGDNHPWTDIVGKQIISLQNRLLEQEPATVYTITFEGESSDLSGEYVVLEFANWSIDSTNLLFDVRDEMKGKAVPNVLMMKDGVISKHVLKDGTVSLHLKEIGEKEKARIKKLYRQWKKAH